MSISDGIRRFAEDPEAFCDELPLPARRIVRPAFSLALSPTPTHSVVSHVRATAEALDAVIAEVRALVREAGYSRVVWSVGPSARPEGLRARLIERGFVPATAEPVEPTMTAMVLARAPEGRPAGVEARRAESLDELIAAIRIAAEAFGMSEADVNGWLAAAPTLWGQQDGVHRFIHLAFIAGKPVGFAFNLTGPDGLLLGGSGVLPSARGQGAYRAILAARWEDAVRLGKPALIVQAGAMSRPILERCGFEAVCHIDMLDDVVYAKTLTPPPKVP